MLSIIFIIFGLIVGSFLSVCIYRIPAARDDLRLDPFDDEGNELPVEEQPDPALKDLSLTNPPRSFCPNCKNKLAWYHNIPVVSWLALGGACAFCKSKISVRYPVVELLTAIFSLLTFSTFGITPTAVVIFVFVCALIVISFIDYDFYIIPDVISLPGTAIAAIIVVTNHFTHIFEAPIAATMIEGFWGYILGAGFLHIFNYLFYLIRRKHGLGLGDVKLLGMTGILLGPAASIYTIFLGSLVGSVLGILLVVLSGRKFAKPIPFGPYLVLGTLLYIYLGTDIGNWWFEIVGAPGAVGR